MGGNLWLPGEVGILRGCKRDPKISPMKHGILKSLTGLRLSWPVIIGMTRFQLESRPEWPIHSILVETFRSKTISALPCDTGERG
ncbi:uncharacterized protein BO88DRAFT_455710 [Aspergillus vadensis CBS 113365]|uniref:Uncharacterized protein n=1 Tax=Aspergillus vadensis (strain CBS 113365 / IMI 142717 / IBT 24658) TaxID=1448311 RepID=A0A319B2A4_ASPVC|nr:hypothetical protein BO88DRAFT_455710 [Aspergillus vadensis CBS 113365]PYH66797.1 hypothetical protein BO88DRAFT_455710 [Aspergillus vadensis CBS 113365]